MPTFLIINEADRSIVGADTGYAYSVIQRAREFATEKPGTYLVVEVNARISTRIVIEADEDKYPDAIFGGAFDPVEVKEAV